MLKPLRDCRCAGIKSRAENDAKFFCFAAAAVVFLAGGQRLFASGYEFDGVGAAAVARGGAVIADASDWTAIYWNPANLAGIKGREAGLELKAGKSYTGDGNSLNTPVGNPFDDKKIDSPFTLGSAGAVLPLNDRSALGFGFYVPLAQGVEFSDTAPDPGFFSSIDYKNFMTIGVGNISYSRRLTDSFSAAAGLNALYADLETRSVSDMASSPLLFQRFLLGLGLPGPDAVTQKLDGKGRAAEGVFGVKYELSDKASLGAVFRTGARIAVRGTATAVSRVFDAEKSDFRFTLKQPATSGIGAAWRPGWGATVTCDLGLTWWHGFSNMIEYKTPGLLLQDQPNTFKWRNSYKFRLGIKKVFEKSADLLLGYAFDTPALDKGSLDFANAVDVPMHRVSAGLSRKWGNVRTTLSALSGAGKRRVGGVDYSLSGWYFLGEVRYGF